MSAVTKIELLGKFFKFLILSMKSFESLIYDHPFCITGFQWKSTNPEVFSEGIPQLEITGLPGTSDNFLWILHSKSSLPRLVDFENSYVKYFSSSWLIKPFIFKFKNILLLLSTRSAKGFSVKSTLLSTFVLLNCFSASNRKPLLSYTTTHTLYRPF